MNVTSITPAGGLRADDLREVWQNRDILFFLAWREVKVRYKQTVLGVAWAIVQPIGMMLIFSVFFGGLAKIPSGDVPYPVFSLAGIVPWTLFAQGTSNACSSLVGYRNLVTKVYFPRILLPFSAVLSPTVDFLPSLGALVALVAAYGITPPLLGLLVAPLCILLCLAASLGVGLWTSAAYAYFRDIRYLVGFALSLLLYVSPVVYPTSLVPERWRELYQLNPMVGVIDGFRWALLGAGDFPSGSLATSALVSAGLLLGGVAFFHRLEGSFAERI